MVVLEKRPELNVRSEYESITREVELVVERTDITFHDVAGGKVRISVTVRNDGTGISQPIPMRLESAALGAFVPWQPLARLVVPALEPGESRELSTEVARQRPAPLGDFDRVPPRTLLTAVTSPDESSRQRRSNGMAAIVDLFRGRRTVPRPTSDPAQQLSLASDLWDLVGRSQPHWAGNINVFIGRHPVERHLARALRIYPGRTNMAMFVVGEPARPDAYSFDLAGLSSSWKTTLYEIAGNRSLLIDPSNPRIQEAQWVEANGSLMVMLATQPPADCKTGKLEVHVKRRSSGKTAIVEFDLDPAAQGAGCYFV